jgi:hypothetical protein
MRFHTRFLAQIQRFQRHLPILLIFRDYKVITLFLRKPKNTKIFVFELVSAKLSAEMKRARNFAINIFPVCKTDKRRSSSVNPKSHRIASTENVR